MNRIANFSSKEVVPKVWTPDQRHQHYLETYLRGKFSAPYQT